MEYRENREANLKDKGPTRSFRSSLPQKGGMLLLCCMMASTAGCGEAKKPASSKPQSAYSSEQAIESIKKVKSPDYWPTKGWKTAKPEEHGVDSAALAEMVDQFKGHNLHSFALIRNGYLLAEGYNQDTDADKRQPMYSVTKSFTSAITGMAIEEGILTGVDQKLKDFFPEVQEDQKKANITLDNLLTMTSGLEWDNKGDRSSNEMADSPNWIKYVLNKPVVAQSGTVFNYSNGSSHLMSGILQEAIGIPISYYAKSKLFDPLGISNAAWGTDPQGVSVGGWSLQLTTRDMAKFGLMYLHEGQWDGQNIVPRKWVEASIKQRVKQPIIDGTQGGYGYFWWLKPIASEQNEMLDHDVFYASGSGGQRIFVIPDYNLILAVTADNQKEGYMPEQMLVKAALAVRSDKPLKASSEAEAKLAASLKSFKATADKPE
ncbi:serine hydrolase domain-containing protein [Paenibacillus radicis (ex Xue et al. 2023)]|uniref:Beta-lactamase family protein n=1 Tax=Paenibacillus radicis (ex Xue et al. 2023) TaxID=2972489 RepID=A0ABT1YR92_9BACL|nr:serine hydrolase [Paenibacillus radicis (ex Xue et al. 2023)]MCR8635702.1 beta-lactamase family protein [Paenibacillus radicis (ex Xue et al. 2023)]